MRIAGLVVALLVGLPLAAGAGTNVLTIFGQAFVGDRGPVVGEVIVVSIIHTNNTRETLQHAFTVADGGLYALAFIDYDDDNFVAEAGDRVEAELRDALGSRLGSVTRDIVATAAIESHLQRLDVNAAASGAAPTTWGGIKRLYRYAGSAVEG